MGELIGGWVDVTCRSFLMHLKECFWISLKKEEAIIDLLLHNWIAKNRVRLVLLKKEPLLFSHRPSVCPKSASSLISQKAEVTVKRRQKWERERKTRVNHAIHLVGYIHRGQHWGLHCQRKKEREQFVHGQGWKVECIKVVWRTEERQREREWMGRGEEERKRMSWFKLFL